MFCPQCKAEYRFGFTKCSDCGVDLVEHLPDDSSATRNQDLAVAWRGSDPSAFSAALAALKDAGIACAQISDHDQFVWGWAIPRPRYEILVRKQNLGEALELVAPFGERAPLAHARDILKGRTPFPEAESERSEQESSESPLRAAPDDIMADINVKDATALVWSGEDGQMPQDIKACLTENRIACVISDDSAKHRVMVLPADEARAKEIVREIVEAAPPQ